MLIVQLGKLRLPEVKVSCRTRTASQSLSSVNPVAFVFGVLCEAFRGGREILFLVVFVCFALLQKLSQEEEERKPTGYSSESVLSLPRLQETGPLCLPLSVPGGTLGIRLNDSAS